MNRCSRVLTIATLCFAALTMHTALASAETLSFTPGASPWTTGLGVPPSSRTITPMAGDVNGDGKSDAVTQVNGSLRVGLSTGTSFAASTQWGSTGSGSKDRDLLADVNGDGKADSILLNVKNWYVALSNGSTFGTRTSWGKFLSGSDSTTFVPRVADVNGDGLSDMVGITNGAWWVCISNGTSFGTPVLWRSNFGTDAVTGSTNNMLADVNGDLKADAVSVANATWRVALSTGASFGADVPWTTIPAGVAMKTLLADVDRDGRADAIAAENGTWKVGLSTGSAFSATSTWATGLGTSSGTSVNMLSADVSSDGTSDAVAVVDGTWKVGVATPILDRIKGNDSGWTMPFADEFNDSALDTSSWRITRTDPLAPGPNEPYSDKEGAKYWPQNVTFDGQSLVETIRAPGVQGPSYSTGSVNSFGLKEFTYGYFEARINPPACIGCWPAFWLLPYSTTPTYPPEVDIFEFFPNVNGGLQPYFNSHWGTWTVDQSLLKDLRLMSGGERVLAATGPNYTGGFHTFGLLWTPHDIQPFVDGVGGRVFTGPAVPHQAMYLINTLQQAAKDPQNNAYATPDGAKMETDYIRYYAMPTN